MNDDTRKNGEKLVVTENDRRISGQTHETASSAEAEAGARKKQLKEAGGEKSNVAVRQQIFG